MTSGDAGDRRARWTTGRRIAPLMASVLTATMLLAGCATAGDGADEGAATGTPAVTATPTPSPTPAATPTPTPTPTSSVVGAQQESGVGSAWDEPVLLDVPRGTRSVTVDLTCDEGVRFGAELGDGMGDGPAPLRGVCGDDRPLVWPWPSTTRNLGLTIPEGVAWEASITYSSDPFEQDETLAAECERFSRVSSEVHNADDGFGPYSAFGPEEWNDRIDAAAASMAVLAVESTTELAPHIADTARVLSDRSPVPGAVTDDQQFWAARHAIGDLCARNHTEVVTYAEFGG